MSSTEETTKRTIREQTTVANWLDLLPTNEEAHNDALKPSKEEADAHKEFVLSLFEGVEVGKHVSLIVDATGSLYEKDPIRAIKAMELIGDMLKKDYIISQMPPGLRKLLGVILSED